jgi:hypothetical protein
MDTIDILAPGLYELVIDTPEGEEVSGQLLSHYEPRTIEDIKALGYNSVEDDRAFATVAKASETLSFMYDKMVHPFFRMSARPEVADKLKKARPLRMSYTLFSDKVNPWLKLLTPAVDKVAATRVEIAPDNPFLQLQDTTAHLINQYLVNITEFRDKLTEQMFFNIWGNPVVQKFWGTDNQAPRYIPSETQLDRDALMKNHIDEIKANVAVKNEIEAMFRFLTLLQARRHVMHETVIRVAVSEARKLAPNYKDRDIHEVIKNQAMVVRYDAKLALSSLKEYLDKQDNHANVVDSVKNILTIANRFDGDLVTIVHDLATQLGVSSTSGEDAAAPSKPKPRSK